MKRKWTKNLGLKILSLGLAALIWFVIVNIDDPAITRTFRLSVELRNEEAIANQGMCYEVVEGEAVTITVKGKRSIIEDLTTSDFRAYADLSKLSAWNAVPIKVDLIKYLNESDSPTIQLGNIDTLVVSLEKTVTKQFKVTVVKKGIVDEGYFIGDLRAKPNIIQVTGASSQIDKIEEVRVVVDVSDASENFTATGIPKVYDKEGKEINSAKMTFSSEKVKVVGTLLNTKTVPINVDVQGTPLHGYQYINTEYEPKSVLIAGSKEVLNVVDSIVIPIDITGMYESIESEVNLADYIPKSITLEEESLTVMVNVKIEKLQVKEIGFSIDDIQISNLDNELRLVPNEENNDEFTVNVMGREEDLKKLTIEGLNPHVDLSTKKEAGNYVIEIQFDNVDGISYQNKPTISIELVTNKDSEDEENGNLNTDAETDNEDNGDTNGEPSDENDDTDVNS